MIIEDHTIIENWTEADLENLPDTETDDYEYKSSRIADGNNYRGELMSKLTKAASAFWNTGGGLFVAGVDDGGQIDGGLPARMGKTRLREWVDQALAGVVPAGPYTVRTIEPNGGVNGGISRIRPDHVVLVVAFGESTDLPHMAPDRRYYVRAGAHSNPANHYLVEAIRARRGLRRPLLRGLLREHQRKPGIIELVILAVNDVPALNVSVNFEPLPRFYAHEFGHVFPLQVPIIERDHPFRIDIATYQQRAEWFGPEPVSLHLTYSGVRGNIFDERQVLDPQHSLSPAQFRVKDDDSKALRRISKQLQRLNNLLESRFPGATLLTEDLSDES